MLHSPIFILFFVNTFKAENTQMFKSIIGEIVLQMCFSAFKRPSLKSWNKVLPTRLSQQNENQSNWPGKEGQLYYKKVQGLRGNVNAMIS